MPEDAAQEKALVGCVRAKPDRKEDAWRLSLLGLLILSGTVYAGSLGGLPIWDDRLLIGGYSSAAQCFTKPFLDVYFRPFVALSFYLEGKLWGRVPFFYHQTNILIHVLTTAILVALLRAAFGSRRVALLGGLLFAVQPIQVSAVAWIGGRTDSLCALWVALFAWGLIRGVQSSGRKRVEWFLLSLLTYPEALLTKEQALALLPLVPLAFRCFAPAAQGKERRIGWWVTALYAAECGAFLLLWLRVGPLPPGITNYNLGEQAILFGRTVTYYTLLLLAPAPRWMLVTTVMWLAHLGLWTALSGYAFLALCLALLRRWWRAAPSAAWFLALTLLALLPVSNVIPLASAIVASYRAGVAGLGVAGLLAWGLSGTMRREPGKQVWWNRPAPRWVLGGAYVLWCLGLTLWGIRQWANLLTITRAFVRYDPQAASSQVNIASALNEAGQLDAAEQHLEGLLAWLYGSPAWRSPETALRPLQQDPQILARIHASLDSQTLPRPWLADLYSTLGAIRLNKHDRVGAKIAFQTGLVLNDLDALSNLGLGRVDYYQGDLKEAIRYLQRAQVIAPRAADVRYFLGESYAAQRNWKAACRELEEAVRLSPVLGRNYIALAEAQAQSGDNAGAQRTLQTALHAAPFDKAEIQQRLNRLRTSRP